MTFAHPAWLLGAALAVAAFAWFYWMLERRRDAQALTYSNLDFVLGATKPSRVPAIAMMIAWIIGTATLALALAGPRLVARVPARDASVMICIDTSGSMRAQDVQPTRWEAARAAARTFVDNVPSGTKIGIVSFSSGANVVQVPSSDLEAVRESLDRIPPPNGATAIGDALQTATAQLPEKGKRVIVLLTDGINNRGSDPLEASRTIGARGIVISTVGVGTNNGEIIPGTNERAALDEDSLQTIAANANGTYTAAQDAASLSGAFRRIALETVWEKRRIDASLPFAFGGGILIVATFLAGLATGRIP